MLHSTREKQQLESQIATLRTQGAIGNPTVTRQISALEASIAEKDTEIASLRAREQSIQDRAKADSENAYRQSAQVAANELHNTVTDAHQANILTDQVASDLIDSINNIVVTPENTVRNDFFDHVEAVRNYIRATISHHANRTATSTAIISADPIVSTLSLIHI